jgi:hypothetical protein
VGVVRLAGGEVEEPFQVKNIPEEDLKELLRVCNSIEFIGHEFTGTNDFSLCTMYHVPIPIPMK